MQGCYYTICSLPHLSFSATPPPLSGINFLAFCEIELSSKNMGLISSITLLPPVVVPNTLPSVIKRWYSAERQLRLELARRRAVRLGRQDFISQTAASPFIKKTARQAMALDSPWDADKILDLARWQVLNELTAEDDFGLPYLAVYFLKLQLLERRASFNQQAGQRLRQAIIKQINQLEKTL